MLVPHCLWVLSILVGVESCLQCSSPATSVRGTSSQEKKHPRNSRAGFGNELTILVDDFTDLNQADESLKSALVPSKIVEMFQATAWAWKRKKLNLVYGGCPKLVLEDNHSGTGNYYWFLNVQHMQIMTQKLREKTSVKTFICLGDTPQCFTSPCFELQFPRSLSYLHAVPRNNAGTSENHDRGWYMSGFGVVEHQFLLYLCWVICPCSGKKICADWNHQPLDHCNDFV